MKISDKVSPEAKAWGEAEAARIVRPGVKRRPYSDFRADAEARGLTPPRKPNATT
jgi:hypothetical protein